MAVDGINSALNILRADAVSARNEALENPSVPDRDTDRHDASAKLFNDLATDLKQYRNSPKLVKGAVEALVDSELIADLGFHPHMKASVSPSEIDFTDEKTGTVVKVTDEGVTTSPNVWELAQQRLKKAGISPTRENVVDECLHILNTKYMRENGNVWNVAIKDLQESGIDKPTGTQIAKEVNRLAKQNGLTDADYVQFLQPIDTTPDSWTHKRQSQPKHK
jgi:hypothetical protein